MKVYGVQLDIAWEDKPANHSAVSRLLKNAAPVRGSLVLLPEMFSTGFSMHVAEIDDGEGREDWNFLSATAREREVYLVGGLVTRNVAGRGLNQAVVFNPSGGEIARYSKLHPFTPGKEAQHYDAGSEVVTFTCGDFTVAPFICYDLRFPEAFRHAMRKGATLLTVMANWPTARVDHWVTLLRARAVENQSYVVGVNRCGSDPFLQYPGRSLIIDPRGNLSAEAGAEESVISAEIDLDALRTCRRELPFLDDMRDDLLT